MREFHFFTLGALAVMVFYTMIQFYLFRRKEMLFLLAYLVLSAVTFSTQWYYYDIAMAGDRQMYEIFYSVFPALSFIAYLLFAHSHLGIPSKSPVMHKTIVAAVAVLFIYVIFDMLLIFKGKYDYHVTLFTWIRSLLIALATVMAFYFYRHYREEGKYFVAGTLLLLAGGAVTLMLQHDFPVKRLKTESLNLTAPILYYRTGIILQSFFFLFGINKKIQLIEIREKNLELLLEKERIERELEKHKAIEQTRSTIASDLHDDIGATLSSINIYSQLAKESLLNGKSEATPLLEKISDASQEMMNNMSDVIWSIKPSQNETENLADRIRNTASEFLTPAGISFEMKENSPEKKSLSISHEVKRNIFLIAKEALNNIVKYSKASNVLIELEVSERQLNLQIKDNGTGFSISEAMNSKGNGLHNMKHRTEQSGGVFELKSSAADGTMIKASFRIDKIIY